MKNFGKYILFLISLFERREKLKTYFSLTINECIKIGYDSLFIVSIVSIFMGAVTTIQTAYNLVGPLIPDYVISLVVRDMTLLELSPTIIAIVFAGKVGSNIAGELGTMRITEQIDALEVMGVNSSSYLVLPKIIAALLMFPILVIISATLAIFGGYAAGVLTGVITGQEYIYGIRYEFNPCLLYTSPSPRDSWYQGYYTSGGALEVGKSSTNAVTNSCIAILIADYILAQILLW